MVPSLGTISARLEYRRKRRECDPFIYTERFKTVWYSDTEGPNGEPVRMTVPFTVDVSDIFNSFVSWKTEKRTFLTILLQVFSKSICFQTHNTVPQSIRDKTFQYAMERASQLAKFRHLFAMNVTYERSSLSPVSFRTQTPDVFHLPLSISPSMNPNPELSGVADIPKCRTPTPPNFVRL